MVRSDLSAEAHTIQATSRVISVRKPAGQKKRRGREKENKKKRKEEKEKKKNKEGKKEERRKGEREREEKGEEEEEENKKTEPEKKKAKKRRGANRQEGEERQHKKERRKKRRKERETRKTDEERQHNQRSKQGGREEEGGARTGKITSAKGREPSSLKLNPFLSIQLSHISIAPHNSSHSWREEDDDKEEDGVEVAVQQDDEEEDVREGVDVDEMSSSTSMHLTLRSSKVPLYSRETASSSIFYLTSFRRRRYTFCSCSFRRVFRAEVTVSFLCHQPCSYLSTAV